MLHKSSPPSAWNHCVISTYSVGIKWDSTDMTTNSCILGWFIFGNNLIASLAHGEWIKTIGRFLILNHGYLLRIQKSYYTHLTSEKKQLKILYYFLFNFWITTCLDTTSTPTNPMYNWKKILFTMKEYLKTLVGVLVGFDGLLNGSYLIVQLTLLLCYGTLGTSFWTRIGSVWVWMVVYGIDSCNFELLWIVVPGRVVYTY